MILKLKSRLTLFSLICVVPVAATAREPSASAAPAEVVKELRAFFAGQDQANRDGLTAAELAKRFYSEDAIVSGEGDAAPRRGIKEAVVALEDWFTYLGPNGNKGCTFAVRDTVVSSTRDMASVFAELSCKPNPPKTTKQETIRQLFVLKRTPHGWHVVREMWQAGSFGT